jgi:hypothetical protein
VAAPNTGSLTPQLLQLGMTADGVERVFSTFNVAAPGFSPASRARAADPVSPADEDEPGSANVSAG